MAIVLSLLAAMAYGLSDFVGGVFSKRVSPWSVAFVGALGRRGCGRGLRTGRRR